MTLDKGKNIESRLYSKFLQKKNCNKRIGLLGCNFSIFKDDLIKINGFNEDYIYPGIGEDSDIEWRLHQHGINNKNIKFIAIEYHLYHQSTYTQSKFNLQIFKDTKENKLSICSNGLEKIET